MALPFDTAHLLNHMRAAYMSSLDDDIYSTRIIEPYVLNLPNETQLERQTHEEMLECYSEQFRLCESPPIQFELLNKEKDREEGGGGLKGSGGGTGVGGPNGRLTDRFSAITLDERKEDNMLEENDHSSIITPITSPQAQDMVTPPPPQRQELSGLTTAATNIYTIDSRETSSTITGSHGTELKSSKTIRKPYKPSIARIFRSGNNSNNNSDPNSKNASKVPLTDSDDDLADTSKDTDLNSDNTSNNNASGSHIEENDVMGEEGANLFEIINTEASVQDQNDGKYLSKIDHNIGYDEDDSNVSISDFTDIDSDMESSSILDSSFDEDDTDFSDFNMSKTNSASLTNRLRKHGKRNTKHSFDASVMLNSSSRRLSKAKHGHSGPNHNGSSSTSLRIIKSIKNQPDVLLSLNPSTKLPDMVNKIEPVKPSLKSSLTELIRERFGTKKDPLEYYLFVANDGDGTKLTNLKIFLPDSSSPSVPLMDVKIRNDVVVFDAIGYILYKYNKDKGLGIELTNPNKWRLELVDEDGENYGEFGILDRTRIISTYGVEEVALCKVNDSECETNTKLTPLPFQFKEHDDPNIEENEQNNDIIELKIFDYPYNPLTFNYASIFISIQSTILDVLKKICQERKLNQNSYCLRDVGGTTSIILDNQQVLYDLHTNNLELVPLENIGTNSSHIKAQLNLNGSLNTLATNITPQNNQLTTTPPRKQLLNRQSRHFHNVSRDLRASQIENAKFKEMLKETPDKMSNRTVYLKWTVWRKKSSLLNKQERSLTIDGDYVHLTPADNRMWDENTKTSTFHINQIVRTKHYKKYPTHLKIVITKNNNLKRYDLEAKTSREAIEIIEKLKLIMAAYRMNSFR